ncbi:uncharacterized protein LOC119445973 [Dermacentor silvarum]|uniref:uncharacterized protein LOC119445973 n=1 Tax=Dermacentor silvarum TaxID=543639 RepID=UPI001897BB33|nr:uncharacterized protein LOC119445973 [Dermacentor silvarum]
MVNERITTHLEENDRYPHTMFDFCQILSTQDVLCQLKEDILGPFEQTQQDIHSLALDVKGTFNNVSHEAKPIEDIGCGAKTYACMRVFLSNRTATVGITILRSKTFHLPNSGTPQCSVVSPLLFNVALLKLPRLLDTVPGICHDLYADDITLWTRGASTGEQEDHLQEAFNIIERYLNTCGLHCAPDKSELWARTPGRPPKP